MEGIIDKENERVRRFFALLDDMEKKVERLARDNRPPFNGERFLTDRELSGTLRISRRCLQDYRDQGRIPFSSFHQPVHVRGYLPVGDLSVDLRAVDIRMAHYPGDALYRNARGQCQGPERMPGHVVGQVLFHA